MMDYNERSINELWKSQEEGYSLRRHLRNVDILHFSWNEENQSEDCLMYMLDGQTPVKECMEFVDGLLNIDELNSENETKILDESIEASLVKSRRMLNYDPNDGYDVSAPVQTIEQSEVTKELDVDCFLHDNMQWATELSGAGHAFGLESTVQISEGCVTNYSGEMDMSTWCPEMVTCDIKKVSDNNSDHRTSCNPPQTVDDNVTKNSKTTPSPQIKFKCRRSYVQTPAKLVTSVVYPFALVKPSGAKGDITLNDINQIIHSPSFLNTQGLKDVDTSLVHYPTSTFSGKPVVAKTKIRTEGGKGSIIIMRTRG